MATNAAAALFAAALPRNPIASTSTTNHPNTLDPNYSLRGQRGRRGVVRGRGGRGRGGSTGMRADDDVMRVEDDMSNGGGKARGRPAARHGSGPMGDRPLMRVNGKPYKPPNHNSPSILRDDSSAPIKSPAIETLRLFLLSRYSPQAKLLNMENMADDPVLKEAGVLPPGVKGASTTLAGALWKLAGEMFPEVESLSLANNSLRSLLPLSPFLLTTHLPNILNVSFASNSIGDMRQLDPFSSVSGATRKDKKPKGWKTLRELVMTGNPIVEEGSGAIHYQREIARRFPSLKSLDQQPIDVSIAFTASTSNPSDPNPGLSSTSKSEVAKRRSVREPIVFPVPIAPGFNENEGTRAFVAGFFLKFFSAYDTDRASLLSAYGSTSSFSFFADTATPTRTRARKIGGHGDRKFPNQHKLDWKPYLNNDGSRNLMRIKNPDKRVATIKVTPTSIVSHIISLPKTIHPLTDPEKFVFESWSMPEFLPSPVPGTPGETVMFAVIHGQFTESPSNGIRSFDRTFVLAPALPGSTAQLAGWPCIIVSDVLAVRGYSDPKSWAIPRPPAPAVPAVVAEVAPPAVVQPAVDTPTEEQQALVLQFQKFTKLTPNFAHLCLVQNGWNAEVAFANFDALKAAGGLPAEAFEA